MKKRELVDLRNKDLLELRKREKDARKELTQSIIELKMGKVKNVHDSNTKRKNIARILTFLKIASFASAKTQENKEKQVKENENGAL